MRRDALRLRDMAEAAAKVAEYLAEVYAEQFIANDLLRDATIRQLTVIGEAAFKVSNEFRAEHPQIPWNQIAAFRHRLVHDYFGLDLDAVWQIAKIELPALRLEIEAILSDGE